MIKENVLEILFSEITGPSEDHGMFLMVLYKDYVLMLIGNSKVPIG